MIELAIPLKRLVRASVVSSESKYNGTQMERGEGSGKADTAHDEQSVDHLGETSNKLTRNGYDERANGQERSDHRPGIVGRRRKL